MNRTLDEVIEETYLYLRMMIDSANRVDAKMTRQAWYDIHKRTDSVEIRALLAARPPFNPVWQHDA